MELSFFARGFVLGISIAAPVGPIGVLVIRRTLADGRASGLVTGLGAATADAIYGLIGGLGVAAASGLLDRHAVWLRLGGGLFLCWLGWRTLLAAPAAAATRAEAPSHARAFATTLLLTLANPTTILSFAAAFAALGLAGSGGGGAVLLLVTGVFLGSAAWWLLLSGGIALVRERLDTAALRWINRISGVVLGGFGLLAVASALR